METKILKPFNEKDYINCSTSYSYHDMSIKKILSGLKIKIFWDFNQLFKSKRNWQNRKKEHKCEISKLITIIED